MAFTPDRKKRETIRHRADLPIRVKLNEVVPDQQEYLNNISMGGLSFKSTVPVPEGTAISISVPLTRPVFQSEAKVVWCRRNGDNFDVGAEFTGAKDPFKLRMVEQICDIEAYKNEIFDTENRVLTGEQAALEWIAKYADKFPEK